MSYRLLHIILAGLIYTSSMGVVLNAHFCQGKLRSRALFVTAERCPNEQTVPVCSRHRAAMPKNRCCHDKSRYCKLDIEQSFDQPVLTQVLSGPVIAPALFFRSFVSPEIHPVHYRNYKPPLLVWDRPVVFRMFLC